MHTLRTTQPCEALRHYVRAYAQRQTGARNLVVVESCPAQLETILHFELGNRIDIWYSDGRHLISDSINVVSCHTTFAAHAELKAGVESFAIFFQPTGFWRLFGVPISELTDRGGMEGTGLLGSSIRTLWNSLGEMPSFDGRVQLTEQFLLSRLNYVETASGLTSAADYLFRMHGCISIPHVAEHAGIRLRQFERQFLHDFGMRPKVFARVARFQAAVDKKIAQPTCSWLDIAHYFGYHDQMHMIHDFKKLGGDAPTEFLERLGNMRFPALSSTA